MFTPNQVLETIADPIIVCDAEGNISFVNDAAINILGYSKSEFLGKPIKDLIDISSPSVVKYFQTILKTENIRDKEFIFLTKKAQPIQVNLSIS